MRTLLTVVATSFVAACAVEPTPATTEAKGDVCQREYRVGSNIPVVSCAPARTEAERQQMIDDLRNQLRGAPSTGKGGPGG